MDRQTVGSLAGVAAIATLMLGAAAGCGFSTTGPNADPQCEEPDLTESCGPEEDPVDTTMQFEEADQLRLAGLTFQSTAVHG